MRDHLVGCVIMSTQDRISAGMSVCVKITCVTVSAVCVPASACLHVDTCVSEDDPYHILAITESLKQKLQDKDVA